MMINRQAIFCLAFFFIFFLGCASEDEHDHSGHGEEYHMKPRKTDDLNALMHKSTDSVNALVNGLISKDKKNLFIGTANLTAIADLASQFPPPKDEDQLDKYIALYKNQRMISASIRRSFLKKQYKETTEFLSDLLLNCLACHNQYKP
jgi:hypothetical protein